MGSRARWLVRFFLDESKMFAVRVWCVVLLMCVAVLHAQPADDRLKRELAFPGASVAAQQRPILSEAGHDTALDRDQRSPDDEYEDYVEDDSPEGRHLHKIKRKLKRKFKPHKHQNILGGFGGFGGYGGHGYGGHHQHPHHGGHGGHDCRKLHGCGGLGGWQQPYGGGPIATAIGGPSYGGGWNPGFGGYGSRPGSNAHAAAWNFGPFSFGLANAGK